MLLNKDSYLQTAFVFVDSIPESKESKEKDLDKETKFASIEDEGEVFMIVGDKLYRFSFDEII